MLISSSADAPWLSTWNTDARSATKSSIVPQISHRTDGGTNPDHRRQLTTTSKSTTTTTRMRRKTTTVLPRRWKTRDTIASFAPSPSRGSIAWRNTWFRPTRRPKEGARSRPRPRPCPRRPRGTALLNCWVKVRSSPARRRGCCRASIMTCPSPPPRPRRFLAPPKYCRHLVKDDWARGRFKICQWNDCLSVLLYLYRLWNYLSLSSSSFKTKEITVNPCCHIGIENWMPYLCTYIK